MFYSMLSSYVLHFRSSAYDFDLGGMDQSWNSSQWVAVEADKDGQDQSEDELPQYDGPADNKAGI